MSKTLNRLKAWRLEKVFHFWLWWERFSLQASSPNISEEQAAHFKGTPGTRYVKIKPGKARLK